MRKLPSGVIVGLVICLVAGGSWAQMFNVTFLHTPPARSVAGQDLVISGNIIGADQVSIAALSFRRVGKEDFEIRELKLVGADMYEGIIPGKDIQEPGVEYYCYAVDFEGNRHTVFASEQQPQRVPVVTTQAVAPKPPPKRDKPKDKRSDPKDKPKSDDPDSGDPDLDGGELDADLAIYAAEDVLEIATRSRQTVERAPAIVSVVSSDQITDMGARTVADVLDQLPGISVARSVSGDFLLAIRGVQSSPQILVLLDGHRINDLYSGLALLEFPAEAVERVEVIRGPGSALYGTGAFVGVVNIITRQGTPFHFSASYGRFHESRVSVGGGWGNDSFEIGGQAQFVYSQGHDRVLETDVLTGVVGTIESEDVSNTPGSIDDGRLQAHAQLHAAVKNLAKGELKLLTHYIFQQRGAFVGKLDSLDRESDLSVHLIDLDLSYKVPVGDSVRIDTRAYFDTHMVDREFQVIRAPVDEFGNAYQAGTVILRDGMRDIDAYQSMTTGVEISTDAQLLDNNLLVVGAQFEYLSLSSFTQERDVGSATCEPCAASESGCVLFKGFELPCGKLEGVPSGKSRIVFGFFAQDQWTDVLPGLDLLAGFRLDYFTDFGLTFNPRVAVTYGPIDGLRFKVLYAQAFRAPTFKELYDDPLFDPIRSFQGNDSLDPVKINTLEVGVEGHVETAKVDYRLRGNFFFNWISDSVESLDQGTGLPTYDNVEKLNVYGTEVEGVARFGKRNRVFVNSSWFRAEAKSAGNSSYITDVPQMRLNAGLDLGVFEWLNVHVGLRYGSERRNNTRQQIELLRSFRIPAYTLVRIGLSTGPVVADHLEFFAHAYNVFDHDMRDPPPRPDHLTEYLPRAPFGFMVGIAWRP